MKQKTKDTNFTDSANQENKRIEIAIVGGGIGGLYTAWRILSDSPDKFNVTLYESDSRLGGRILSQEILGLPFRAELGAMRFRLSHQILCALLDEFHIQTRKFDVSPPVYYIRGRLLTERELELGKCNRCGAGIPFHLRDDERNCSPSKLIEDTVVKAIEKLNLVGDIKELGHTEANRLKKKLLQKNRSPETWEKVKKYGRFGDIPLYNIGFWNLLHHFLSNEAFVMLHDFLSLDSILGNWNAAEAIPWFLNDFANNDFEMIPGGTESIIKKLENAINKLSESSGNFTFSKNSKVLSILCEKDEKNDQTGRWELEIKKDKELSDKRSFDKVVLALPKQSIETLKNKIELPKRESERLEKDKKDPASVFNWVSWVRPHRMFKLFLVYETPWWIDDDFPDSDTGRVYTDLPLRQIYYFSPTWMRRCHEVAKLTPLEPSEPKHWFDQPETKRWLEEQPETRQWALVMASYSDDQHVSFWNPVLSGPTLHPEANKEGERTYFSFPANLPADFEEKIKKEIPSKLFASERMIEKVQRQLEEIHHGKSIPKPIFGIFKDWGADPFAGGWHTWEVGTKPWEKMNKFTEDFPNLYLCGEAYSSEQGWMESALKTAESVLTQLQVPEHDWKKGQAITDLKNYIMQ